MIDWVARIDELAFHLAREYRVEDREAIEILLAALVDCPRTPAPWLVLETNFYQRDCRLGWFSFGGAWLPESLPLLRAMRSRNANALIAQALNELHGRLYVECDYDRRLPRYRALSEIRFLLAKSLNLRVVSPLDGISSPIDERLADRRADQLRALASDVLQDRAGARPADPPRLSAEPPAFLYHTQLAVRLAGRHSDYGQTARALRALAVRRACLYGRHETDASDWQPLSRILRDTVPPWIARVIQYLVDASHHKAQAPTLQRWMSLDDGDPNHELARLHRCGLLDWNDTQKIWSLAPDHVEGVRALLATSALQPLAAPSRPAGR